MPTNFDERARTWDDDPAKVARARAVAEAVRAEVELGEATRLLEYGAGTALVSQELASHVGTITLAEPSAGMRDVLAAKVAAGALPGDTRIWDLDLTTHEPPDEWFDVVVTAMTLHHVRELDPVLAGFADLLVAGGQLCIADLEAEDGSFHDDDADFDGHHGFARSELAARLEAAGFRRIRFEPCHFVEKQGRTYPMFLATCSAP